MCHVDETYSALALRAGLLLIDLTGPDLTTYENPGPPAQGLARADRDQILGRLRQPVQSLESWQIRRGLVGSAAHRVGDFLRAVSFVTAKFAELLEP